MPMRAKLCQRQQCQRIVHVEDHGLRNHGEAIFESESLSWFVQSNTVLPERCGGIGTMRWTMRWLASYQHVIVAK